jgi:hypothetical protein
MGHSAARSWGSLESSCVYRRACWRSSSSLSLLPSVYMLLSTFPAELHQHQTNTPTSPTLHSLCSAPLPDPFPSPPPRKATQPRLLIHQVHPATRILGRHEDGVEEPLRLPNLLGVVRADWPLATEVAEVAHHAGLLRRAVPVARLLHSDLDGGGMNMQRLRTADESDQRLTTSWPIDPACAHNQPPQPHVPRPPASHLGVMTINDHVEAVR